MLRPCSAAVGPVLSTILVVPVCYGPSMAVGSSNYIEIGQSSNWLRTDRGTSLNVGARSPYLSRTPMRKLLIQKKYRPMCVLRPGLYDQLDEATLNAALATIDSMQPRSELQAILAVQIIATGFAGLRFLRQSHRNMTEDFINVYGNYAIKLLRLQNDMIQT